MISVLQPPHQAKPSNNVEAFLLNKHLVHGTGRVRLPCRSMAGFRKTQRSVGLGGMIKPNAIKAVAVSAEEETIPVTALVTVSIFSDSATDRGLDDDTDLLGRDLLLELVSAELYPKTGLEKGTIPGTAHKASQENVTAKYECSFKVPSDFGEVGAILVENGHHKEMFLRNIVLEGFPSGPVSISCGSWVHPKIDNSQKRVFFINKSYIPSKTPSGLKKLREEELVSLRGNGQGERKLYERIYDYDVYNDLVDPEKNLNPRRPVLGGKAFPYPRRCRTGRPTCKPDPELESRTRTERIYVPRDEQFSEIKQSMLHAAVPLLETSSRDSDGGFESFTSIDKLAAEISLRFKTLDAMLRDRFFWNRDDEFARQTLAGVNPVAIQLVMEWPLKSKLDPKDYGPAASAITTEMVEKEIGGLTTVEEAIKQKKLFILDYHDLLLPYVHKARKLEGTTLYGSRTLFFLTPDGTLRPVAIELTRPQAPDGTPQWRQVFRPAWNSTDCWLWRLAKTHVLAHDSGYHQLVSHWLRTHCCTEPYIIATNRQLSAMHPIYRLLHPHFRYTMAINAFARGDLISGDGIIETSFSPKGYSMELSAVAYDQLWQFDLQALPNDLINRGLAMNDPSSPHGLKLVIEDYPYANDGLLIWDTLKEWVTDYVNYYYPEPNHVATDIELQAWWMEIQIVGHGDKKDATWWPTLKTSVDLIEILTIIIWVASGHHAAINFGQYAYGGYFPNRPTIARIKMPTEDAIKEDTFLEKPEAILFETFPSRVQAITVMVTLELLSNHSSDEEYLGENPEPSWKEDPIIAAAFEKFNGRLKEIEGVIDKRNENQKLKNRSGAGILPYQLLKPFSEPGVTGKGVPYSISI